jgi:hypothetical protein
MIGLYPGSVAFYTNEATPLWLGFIFADNIDVSDSSGSITHPTPRPRPHSTAFASFSHAYRR